MGGVVDEAGQPDCGVYLNDLDPADQTDWPRQYSWLATNLNAMHRAFANRVKALNPDQWRPTT